MFNTHWHHIPASEALDLLEVDPQTGLDTFEINHRRSQFGLNQLTPPKGKSKFIKFLDQFNNPLIYILLAAALVTALLKDPLDAIVIFGVVLINAVIGYIQEARAEQTLAALTQTMTTEADVIRGGKPHRLPSTELVPGDIVQLQAGARVPADIRLVSSRELRIDEAALTGESVPAEKNAEVVLPHETVLAERANMAYSSTLINRGAGLGVVVSTGDRTEIGRISQLVSGAAPQDTPLTRSLDRFSKTLLVVILILAGLTLLIGLARGLDFVETLFTAIALAVGAIPEGLPAALTITLAIGVSRMASRRAIIRNLPAVETLGSTTVICSDKTGTLTQNQMTVVELYTLAGSYPVSGDGYAPTGEIGGNWQPDQALQTMLQAGAWCNDSRIIEESGAWKVQGDPTEGALLTIAAKGGLETAPANRLDSIPFDSQHQFMATLHPGGIVYIKGAAEVLLKNCSQSLDAAGNPLACSLDQFQAAVDDMAGRGMRVLAFAYLHKPGLQKLEFADIDNLTLLGLQGMIDPPRQEVIGAVRACQQAGIVVKMITGDHARTAAAVGRAIGLCADGCETVLTGAELAYLTDEQLIEQAAQVNIFARVAPEQKLRLVEALQARGQVVAMTGDGVNDAPALKQADIGVAMGISGTDVSKEAADMVLTDDNFSTIEAAVEEGRGVFDNITKFIAWTLPTNLGEGLILLAALIIGAVLPILPIQILWINMVTAAVLGTTLALEPKEADIMRRKPRRQNAPILTPVIIQRIILVGLIILLGAFLLFEYEIRRGASIEVARTVAVNVVVFVELFYLFNARSLTRSPFALGFFTNRWVIGGALMMILIQLLYTYLPVMNRLFESAPLPASLWLDVLAVSLLAFVVVEIEKWLRRRASR